MGNWNDYAQKVPTSTWRSTMTVPRELALKKTSDGFRLFQEPVADLEKLRKDKIVLKNQTILDSLKIDEASVTKDIQLTFDVSKSTANSFGFYLANNKREYLKIGYDVSKAELFIDRTHSGESGFSSFFARTHTAPYKISDSVTIRALVDVASIEIFVDGGSLAMTEIFFPSEDFSQLKIFSEGGSVLLKNGEIFQMNSIWQ